MIDTHRLVIVLVVAALVYAAAGLFLMRLMLRWVDRRRGREVPADADPAARKWIERVVMALAALGLLCWPYARLVEPYWPQVEHVRLESAKLPLGSGPVRLVLLSDTHCDPEVRSELKLPDLVAELKPDAIIFVGDALNSEEALPVFRQLATRLAAIAPTYAVRGNWEVWWFRHLDVFAGTGMVSLDGQAVPLRVRGAEVWLGGVTVGNDLGVRAALSKVPAKKFCVLAHHYPEAGAGAVLAGADLAVSGDTHGGQIRLPLLGALVRISREKPGAYWDAGLHRLGQGWLYVNRGIGMEGGRAPRLRFMCRPEVTLIEIGPLGAFSRD